MTASESTTSGLDAWICFEDEADRGIRPPTTPTWGRRGHTR
ncbi:hypothetical protein AB0M72_13675 [Nocardiopsis dassonvillei]